MTEEQKSNLARTAIFMLEDRNMKDYSEIPSEVGTSCCLVNYCGDLWQFLFSSMWPNRKRDAAARVLFYLENESLPEKFCGKERYYRQLNKSEVAERLEKFV